jgi:hypothetical protein
VIYSPKSAAPAQGHLEPLADHHRHHRSPSALWSDNPLNAVTRHSVVESSTIKPYHPLLFVHLLTLLRAFAQWIEEEDVGHTWFRLAFSSLTTGH